MSLYIMYFIYNSNINSVGLQMNVKRHICIHTIKLSLKKTINSNKYHGNAYLMIVLKQAIRY